MIAYTSRRSRTTRCRYQSLGESRTCTPSLDRWSSTTIKTTISERTWSLWGAGRTRTNNFASLWRSTSLSLPRNPHERVVWIRRNQNFITRYFLWRTRRWPKSWTLVCSMKRPHGSIRTISAFFCCSASWLTSRKRRRSKKWGNVLATALTL